MHINTDENRRIPIHTYNRYHVYRLYECILSNTTIHTSTYQYIIVCHACQSRILSEYRQIQINTYNTYHMYNTYKYIQIYINTCTDVLFRAFMLFCPIYGRILPRACIQARKSRCQQRFDCATGNLSLVHSAPPQAREAQPGPFNRHVMSRSRRSSEDKKQLCWQGPSHMASRSSVCSKL